MPRKNFSAVLALVLLGVFAYFVASKLNKDKFAPSEDIATQSKSVTGAVVPTASLASPAVSKAQPTTEDLRKEKILNEILISKNDNDPRLDREFNGLSPETKELFKKRYHEIQSEKRNQLGTIVFLLGRNLTSESDFNFLNDVLTEPACRSLSDCKKDPDGTSPEGLHEELGTEITLAYPQMVALIAIQKFLARGDIDPKLQEKAMQVLKQSENSQASIVSRKAQQIESEINH